MDYIRRNINNPSDEYRKFCEEKLQCQCCQIYDCAKQPVISEGNGNNPIFIIVGECPGKDESDAVRPFIGRAGQRLREELRKYSKTFNRKTCLITNVMACRPENNEFPRISEWFEIRCGDKNSVKGRELVNFCATKWLCREIKMLNPRVIITLGSKSLEYVRGDSGITSNRGAWKFLPEYKAWSFATYHPSYVLRCNNDPSKEYVVEQFEDDFKTISETWFSTVNNDPRIKMSPQEWEIEKALV